MNSSPNVKPVRLVKVRKVVAKSGEGKEALPGDKAGKVREFNRKLRSVQVGHLVRGFVETEARRKGIVAAQVLGMWPRICPLLAQWSYPGDLKNGVLTVVVASDAVKQELLYLTPQVVDSVNLLLGYEGVKKVMAITRHFTPREVKMLAKVAPPGAAAIAKAEAKCKDVRDPELRQALQRLGAQIFKDNAKDKKG